MQLNLKTAAQLFNNSQYPLRLEYHQIETLKKAGLALVFGESDDLIEVVGAIQDETGAYEGGEFYLGSTGWLLISEVGTLQCDVDTIEDAKKLVKEYDRSLKIKAEWDKDGYSWIISISGNVEVPHAVFDILEDGEKFCRAIVVQVPQQEGES